MTPYDPQKYHRRSIRLKGYDYTQPGAYFVTMVTSQRDEVFGAVVNGEMQLSALGQIAKDEWMRSIGIRREIRLNEDEFVVMPNHIHGIVWMVGDGWVGDKEGVRPEDKEGAEKEEGEGACHAPQRDHAPPPTPQPESQPETQPTPQQGLNNGDGWIRADGDGWVGADGVRPGEGEGACHAPQPAPQRDYAPQSETQRTIQRAPKSLASFIAGFKAAVTSRARRELDLSDVWQRNYYEHIIRNEREFMSIWNYIDANPLHWHEDQLRLPIKIIRNKPC